MYDILSVYLENGLRVIMHRIPYMKTVSCGIWVKQGSKNEDEKNNGLSHLLEHLMINIDNTHNKKFQQLINKATLEGIVYNAGTTKENTCFYFTGLTKTLPICINILGSMIIENKTFFEELVDNEKKVVNQEAVSFYSSFNQIQERTSQALWGNLDVGRIIVGDLNNIRNATVSQLEEIIDYAYTPENSALIIVGDIDYEEVLKLVEEEFSRWEDRITKKYEDVVNSEPGIYFNSGGTKSTVLSIGFRAPSYNDSKRLPVELITNILGSPTLESRLVQEIRMKRGMAYSVGAFTNFYANRGSIGFTAVCQNDLAQDVVEVMMNEFKKIKEYGVTKDEIDRVKNSLETKTVLELESITAQLRFLGRSVSYGKLFSLEEEIRNIKRVTEDDLNEVIEELFVNENIGLASIGNCDPDKIISRIEF